MVLAACTSADSAHSRQLAPEVLAQPLAVHAQALAVLAYLAVLVQFLVLVHLAVPGALAHWEASA